MTESSSHYSTTTPAALRRSLRTGYSMPMRTVTLQQPKIIATAQKIIQIHQGTGRQPAPLELDVLYARFIQASKANNWDGITNSDWKKVPWILWYSSPYLAEQEPFMRQFQGLLMTLKNPRMWKRLIHVYLLNFGKHKERSASELRIADWLQTAFKDSALKEALKPWPERDQAIGLFKDASWLKESARTYLLQYGANPKQYWKSFGLMGELEAGGYSTAVGRAILREIRSSLIQRPELIEHAWNYVMKDDENLRLPLLRKELIETLLEPWENSRPTDTVRKNILTRLLTAFKDPRFRTQAAGWAGASELSMHVLRKWLAGVTIEQFFEIIDEIGEENHWDFRRAFWKAYIRHQAVDDARVVLGKQGYTLARRILDKDATAAAELTNSSSASCVLLIRIGDLTIAEFNHNGKCRFWNANHKNVPSLIREEYSDSSLRVEPPACSEAFSHTGSPNYSWQRKFRDYIYHHTNYHIADNEFKVR